MHLLQGLECTLRSTQCGLMSDLFNLANLVNLAKGGLMTGVPLSTADFKLAGNGSVACVQAMHHDEKCMHNDARDIKARWRLLSGGLSTPPSAVSVNPCSPTCQLSITVLSAASVADQATLIIQRGTCVTTSVERSMVCSRAQVME
jgi:hypothetical protein